MKLHHGLRLTYAFQTLDYHPSFIQYVVVFIAFYDSIESMLIYNYNYLGVTSIIYVIIQCIIIFLKTTFLKFHILKFMHFITSFDKHQVRIQAKLQMLTYYF